MEDKNIIVLNKRLNFDVFRFLIENSQDEDLRVNCVNSIKNLNLQTYEVFLFLESLLVCDSNEDVRRTACESLILMNSKKIDNSIAYAILNESGTFLVYLVEILYSINPLLCKQILKQKIQQIERKSPNILLKNQKLDRFNIQQLREILFNSQLNNSLDKLYFHRHSIPIALDLYGLE